MDLILLSALVMIAIGGGITLLIFVYHKLKGESFWTPWISKMERGEPTVSVEAAGYIVQNVIQIAANHGYKLVSVYDISGGIDVGYVSGPYIFVPPQRTAEYMLTFSKV